MFQAPNRRDFADAPRITQARFPSVRQSSGVSPEAQNSTIRHPFEMRTLRSANYSSFCRSHLTGRIMLRHSTLIIAVVCLSIGACAKLSKLQQGPQQQAQQQQAEPQQQQQSQAQPAPKAPDVRETCLAELRQVCASMTPAPDSIQRCIDQSQSKFSERCKSMLQLRARR